MIPAALQNGLWGNGYTESCAQHKHFSVESVLRGRVEALGDPICEQEVGTLRLRVRHLHDKSSRILVSARTAQPSKTRYRSSQSTCLLNFQMTQRSGLSGNMSGNKGSTPG